MRGGTTSTTPTNLGGLALYNNSTGAELLALWTINVGSANTATSGMGLFQGKPQGSALTASPLVSGESIRAGQLVQIDSTTNYLVDYPTTFVSGMPDYLDPGLPYAVLHPGFSLVWQDKTTGDTYVAGFIWQVIHPQDLYGKDCQICDAGA